MIEAHNAGSRCYLQKGGVSTTQFTGLTYNIQILQKRKRTDQVLKETNEDLFEFILYANSPIISRDHRFSKNRLNTALESLAEYLGVMVLGLDAGALFPEGSCELSLDLDKSSSDERNNRLTNICEDKGPGTPLKVNDERRLIKGYTRRSVAYQKRRRSLIEEIGKTQGKGLFLAREVLGINGIAMQTTGDV